MLVPHIEFPTVDRVSDSGSTVRIVCPVQIGIHIVVRVLLLSMLLFRSALAFRRPKHPGQCSHSIQGRIRISVDNHGNFIDHVMHVFSLPTVTKFSPTIQWYKGRFRIRSTKRQIFQFSQEVISPSSSYGILFHEKLNGRHFKQQNINEKKNQVLHRKILSCIFTRCTLKLILSTIAKTVQFISLKETLINDGKNQMHLKTFRFRIMLTYSNDSLRL